MPDLLIGLFIGGVLGYMGLMLIKDGEGWIQDILGIVILGVAGVLIFMSSHGPRELGYIEPKQDCVQVVWLDEEWKCVPKEQAG